MLTPEQKKALGDMLVKRLLTGEDVATATAWVKRYFARRAERETAQALRAKRREAKRAAKRASQRKPKRGAKLAVRRDPTPPKRPPPKRGARGRFVAES